MIVCDDKLGRLGNAIFRFLASTLFCILYKAERMYNIDGYAQAFDDCRFIEWSNSILNSNIIPNIDCNASLIFNGYYQHDKIFLKYKKEIINWIITHPTECLYTDGNRDNITIYNYNMMSFKSLNLIVNPHHLKLYDIVVHLRLEDFINNNEVIHPESIKNLLDKINNKKICFVINKTKTELEDKYIDYFKQFYEITVESNSIIEDYHIMKNAKILICSCSTLSWAAAFFSDKVQCVYFPNCNNNRNHETFKKPIENTILYNFKKCSKNELTNFLFNEPGLLDNTFRLDPYCAQDCNKQPITKIILNYIANIENGFYIEVGAGDGIVQSNTKFIEEEYNWSGILIEQSLLFTKLKLNRPNNININIYDTLENLLDYHDIVKIDLMIIDSKGYELNILKGLNLEKYRPTYLLIEIDESQKNILFLFLKTFNYFLLENITNYNILDNPTWDGTHNDYFFKAI
jgi:hypothetical protein